MKGKKIIELIISIGAVGALYLLTKGPPKIVKPSQPGYNDKPEPPPPGIHYDAASKMWCYTFPVGSPCAGTTICNVNVSDLQLRVSAGCPGGNGAGE